MVFFARMCDEGTQSPNGSSQYAAVGPTGDVLTTEFALDDATGIARLRARLPEASVTCAPELRQAATAAGLPVAELPELERKVMAVMSVLRRHSAKIAELDLSVFIHLLEALARLQRTDWWKTPAAAPAFEVVCADLQPHRWVARFFPLDLPMIALMPPGTAYTIKGSSEIDFEASQRILVVALEGTSGHGRDLLQRAFGLDYTPKLMAVFGSGPLTPSPREVSLLTAALVALARHDGDWSKVRCGVRGGSSTLTLELTPVPPGREPFEGQVQPSQSPPRSISLREALEAGAGPKDVPVVSRGAPCPCGSGEKYKRCHGAHAQAGEHVPLSSAERAALEELLWDLLTLEEHALAQRQYPVPGADEIPNLERLYLAWLLYHFRPQATETAAERYLRIHRKAMDVRVRTHLEAQRSGRVSIWRVQASGEDWVELEDAFGAGTFRVRTRLKMGSQAASRGDALMARLFAVPGEVVFGDAHRTVIRGPAVDSLVGAVQRLGAELGHPADYFARPEADLALVLVKPWHELASQPKKLELVKDET